MKKGVLFCFVLTLISLTLAQPNVGYKGNQSPILTSEGIGLITNGADLDLGTVQKTFPNYIVKILPAVVDDGEGGGDGPESGNPSEFQVFDHDELLLEIVTSYSPETIDEKVSFSQINVLSNKVKNSFGVKLGETFQKIFNGKIPADCKSWDQLYGPPLGVDCRASDKFKNVSYFFKGQWPEGQSGEKLPSNLLESFRLSSITWTRTH